MGWTSARMPAAELVAEEVGGADKIIRKAWGAADYGERTCWLHVRGKDDVEFLAVALVKSWKEHGETVNAVKIVSEDMGPGDFIVPDSIWNNRPELTFDSEYARDWRERVTAFREAWPLKATALTEADVGREFLVDDGSSKGEPITFLGSRRTSKTVMTPVFRFPDGRTYRLRDWKWRHLRTAEALVSA